MFCAVTKNDQAMGVGMERIFKRLERWGIPLESLDWLRRRRLLVIVVIALVGWIAALAVGFAAYFVAGEVGELLWASSDPLATER